MTTKQFHLNQSPPFSSFLWLTTFSIHLLFFRTSADPTTLLAPLTKHTLPNNTLYNVILTSHERYVIDLEAPFSWFVCNAQHTQVPCTTPECGEARSHLCTKYNNDTSPISSCGSCFVTPVNPVTNACAKDRLTLTNIIIYWTNGKNPTIQINYFNRYFSCAPASLLQSLPPNSIGVGSLSNTSLSLISQIAPPFFGVARRYAICLPSTEKAKGVMFFGVGPYYLRPPTDLDASQLVSYTSLVKNPKSLGYYVDLKAISVGGKRMMMRSSCVDHHPELFSLDVTTGLGGVKLSTTVPYTTMRSDVYKLFVRFFKRVFNNRGVHTTKKTYPPFGLCVSTGKLKKSSRVGLKVPKIDLELADGKKWTIYGSNSFKLVEKNVACLAFVDGGEDAEAAMVIGSYQMEDNLMVFDLEQDRLGFSSSLLLEGTTCSNFNYTITEVYI